MSSSTSGKTLCKTKITFLLTAVLILYCLSAAFLPMQVQGTTADIHPILVIERVNAERAVAGEVFYLTVVVKNLGDYPGYNIFAELDCDKIQSEHVFAMESPADEGNPHLAQIDAGETRSFSFPVKVNAKAENLDYSLRISLQSQDAYFKDPVPRTSTSTTIKVEYDISSPSLTVSDVKLDPAEPKGTEPFSAAFFIDNYSGAEAHNVFVEIDGNDNFQVLDTTASKFLPSVTRGSYRFVRFNLQGVENRAANSVIVTFSYEHQGKPVEPSPSITVNLPLEKAAPGTAPSLTVSSFSLAETAREDEYRIRLTLENLGEQPAEEVRLTFDGGNKIFMLQGSNIDHLPSIDGKSSKELEYLLGINHTSGDTHLPLNVKMEYKDSVGNSLDAVNETLGIAAADLKKTETRGKPRVLISKYTLSAEKILAGNIVTLNFFIDNTYTQPVRNIKVSLGVAQVEGSTAGTTASAGTVFSPVAGSNSFFVDRIAARTTLERSVDLLVDPNASAKTYIVPVTIEYEDEDGTEYKSEEMVNIPVTQESKLQVLSVEVPPMAFIGQPAFIGAEFVNVGKVDLANFIVMLEGDFHKEQAAYYVGNLQIGASDYYQGIIYPEQEGALEGELIFAYLDNNNREVQVKEPFHIEVQAGGEMHGPMEGEMPPEMIGPRGPGASPGGGVPKWIYYVAAAVLIAAAAVIILRRRRAKKAREEFLDA